MFSLTDESALGTFIQQYIKSESNCSHLGYVYFLVRLKHNTYGKLYLMSILNTKRKEKLPKQRRNCMNVFNFNQFACFATFNYINIKVFFGSRIPRY